MIPAIRGVPAVFGGSATSTLARVIMTNPFTGLPSFAFSALVKNTAGSNPLKVYLPGIATPITIAANGEDIVPGPVTFLGVLSTSGTTYEILAQVAG